MQVLTKIESSYNAKLPGFYVEQYEYGYWAGYDEAERIACGDLEPSLEDVVELTHDAN